MGDPVAQTESSALPSNFILLGPQHSVKKVKRLQKNCCKNLVFFYNRNSLRRMLEKQMEWNSSKNSDRN